MGHWSAFAYLYLVGGIIFLIPIILGIKTGALRLKYRVDRQILLSFVIAYLIYFITQGLWNILAINSAGA